MNRSALIRWGKEYLEEQGTSEPGAEAELLFLHSGGISRGELYRDPEIPVPAGEEEKYRELIRRRGERIPLFYLLGEREFWSLPIQVAPGVLIPRPETELLVEEAIRLVKECGLRNADCGIKKSSSHPALNSKPETRNSELFFLDLGTGSGAIALAILTEIPEARAWAADLSPDALRIAAGNARRLKLEDRIQFLAGDLFGPLREFREFFHLVVCNPPYIPSAVIPTLASEVARGEPRLALDGGEDGLQVIRRVAEEAFAYLQAPGFLLMEIGDTQAEAARGLLARQGRYEEIRVLQDYSGRDRVVVAKKKVKGQR
ncbi:MAG: peptide chain release factor N(5)-glutamine methyltransferase [bacterium]|nr:peptide chain release factor N(5)-glutamine methyltransferase [bacterium]